MKMTRHVITLVLLLLLLPMEWLPAAESGIEIPLETTTVQQPSAMERLADHISETTLIAISPLLVVGVQSAWEYFQAAPEARDALPWYTQPWLFGTLLGIGVLFMANLAIGNVVPALKTPMNALEQYESKATAFLVGLPVVISKIHPEMAAPPSSEYYHQQLMQQTPETVDASAEQGLQLMTAGLAPDLAVTSLGWLAAIPVLSITFLMVWLAFHTVNVICLVSPFGQIDALVKAFRVGTAGLLLAASSINPYMGMAFALVLIGISYFIAGWSFRLMVFGSVFGRDLLFFKHRKIDGEADVVKGFTSKATEVTPIRSYGELSKTEEGFRFSYRPWLFLPSRHVDYAGSHDVAPGIISPVVFANDTGQGVDQQIIRLNPRYRSHEQAVAERFSMGTREGTIKRGFQGALKWLKEWLNEGPQFMPAAKL